MALTGSRNLSLGVQAPPFSLPDTRTGDTVSIGDFADRRALLVMFICNHCPYVKHVADALAALGRDYAEKSVAIVGISANDARSHPADHPDRMKEEAEARGYVFPYLHDESQEVARAYGAACTPDFYLFDAERTLVYHGQFDDSRPSNYKPVTGRDVRAAIDAVLAGDTPDSRQVPSIGCSIKWRPGNAPDNA
jgi:peroxiredoxin